MIGASAVLDNQGIGSSVVRVSRAVEDTCWQEEVVMCTGTRPWCFGFQVLGLALG